MVKEIKISKAGDTRQIILASGRVLILGKGFTAVGLNEILASAGVPKGSFYHYFKSKEQFGNALLEDYFANYLQKLDLTLQDNGSSVASRLLGFFQSWLDSQSSDHSADKCLVVKLSAEVTDLSETMRVTLKNGTEAVISRLTRAVEQAITLAEFSPNLNANNVTAEIYYMWIGASLLSKVSRTREHLQRAMSATQDRLTLAKAIPFYADEK
jgi:TetR/AcrR family transcriptional repressor of nem operon